MASFPDIFEQLMQLVPSNTSSPNATINGTSPSPLMPLAVVTGLGSLISLFLSVSALRDWAKLLVIGSFFQTGRRIFDAAWSSLVNSFFVTASFEDHDTSYQWMMVWLSKQPSWKKVRNVNISTASFGAEYSGNLMLAGDKLQKNHKLSFLPAPSVSYTLWYKYKWMRITRVSAPMPTHWGPSNKDTLKISILTHDHGVLNDILQEAKQAYDDAQGSFVTVYVSDSANRWRYLAKRNKRPLDSIILDPGIRELIVEDAKDFLSNKEWYAARGIPFRRGYLLYGAPGSGKTSLIHSIAADLGLDVYLICLSHRGLDDIGLSDLISKLPERCIALMEDIDAAFHHGLTREDVPSSPMSPMMESFSTSKVSLSGLLNALDGIGAQEGRILFATTNKYSALDPALCRPGRMDLHVEFKLASRYQAEQLFKRFYLPSSYKLTAGDDQTVALSHADSHTNAHALDKISMDLIDLNVPDDDDDSTAPPSSSSSEKTIPSYTGIHHLGHAPTLSLGELSALAARFAASIEERGVSMASLQGYLMSQKSSPWQAAKEVSTWLEKERADKKAHQTK